MVTPAAIAGPQYYRVGMNITFGWNYTSLSITPTAIDILATNTAQPGVTHTISANQSVSESGLAVWDTAKYTQASKLNLVT